MYKEGEDLNPLVWTIDWLVWFWIEVWIVKKRKQNIEDYLVHVSLNIEQIDKKPHNTILTSWNNKN